MGGGEGRNHGFSPPSFVFDPLRISAGWVNYVKNAHRLKTTRRDWESLYFGVYPTISPSRLDSHKGGKKEKKTS